MMKNQWKKNNKFLFKAGRGTTKGMMSVTIAASLLAIAGLFVTDVCCAEKAQAQTAHPEVLPSHAQVKLPRKSKKTKSKKAQIESLKDSEVVAVGTVEPTIKSSGEAASVNEQSVTPLRIASSADSSSSLGTVASLNSSSISTNTTLSNLNDLLNSIRTDKKVALSLILKVFITRKQVLLLKAVCAICSPSLEMIFFRPKLTWGPLFSISPLILQEKAI